MADVQIAYSGTLIAEMDAQGTKTLHTSGKYCKGNIQIAYTPRSGGPELPELENPGAAEDLMDGKQLIDGAGRIVEGTFTLDAEVTEQDSLIEQIQTAIQNKMVGDAPVIEALEIAANGVYTAPEGVDGYSPITVNVPVPEGYIQPTGTLEITENGEHDVAAYAAVSVNVAESGGGVDESTNTEWLAKLITSGSQSIEIYNDKATGTLEPYAFYYNTNVSKIELPNIEYLKERSFSSCTSLKTLLLPGLMGYTYQYMADGCSNLETVDVHNSSYISSYSFRNCTKLQKIDLHKAETIGTSSFYGCSKLVTLILRMDAVPTLGGTNAFTGTKIASGTGYIYVPSALVDSYKAATNWSTYANQFRAIEDYPDVCG